MKLYDRELEILQDLEKPRERRRVVIWGSLVIDRKLEEMSKEGLVAFVRKDPNVAALSDTYEITDAGREALHAWRMSLRKVAGR